jgi:hypothetical protein
MRMEFEMEGVFVRCVAMVDCPVIEWVEFGFAWDVGGQKSRNCSRVMVHGRRAVVEGRKSGIAGCYVGEL